MIYVVDEAGILMDDIHIRELLIVPASTRVDVTGLIIYFSVAIVILRGTLL